MQDETASAIAEVCGQLMDAIKLEIGTGFVFEVLDARTKAIEGLVKLVCGKLRKGRISEPAWLSFCVSMLFWVYIWCNVWSLSCSGIILSKY